jgi:predicted kinase
MLLGVPGSGKTYFSQQLAERLRGVRLNSDAMRLSIFGSLEAMDKLYNSADRWQLNAYTFGAMDYTTERLLAAGTSVIYDTIHAKRADRQKQEAAAKKHGALPILLRITAPRDITVRRIVERPAAGDSRRFTPQKAEEVIRHFENTTEPPGVDEMVIDINGEQPFDEQFQSFQTQLKKRISDFVSQ